MSLTNLAAERLTEEYAALLERAVQGAAGGKVWQLRKRAEGRDLLALASLAPRMSVVDLDMVGDLRAVVALKMPVPCRSGEGDLVISHEALLGFTYREESLVEALPGSAFAQVLQPQSLFLPNVRPGPAQLVCLGSSMLPGIKLSEIVLMTFRALCLQDHNFDHLNPAGVFRRDAAEWWQENVDRIPLTDEPFLHGCEGGGDEDA